MKNVILLIIIILAGCSAKPYIVSYAEEFEGSGQNEVYVEVMDGIQVLLFQHPKYRE